MNEQLLTEQEEVYYANYGYIGPCDCCGKDTPITNYHDNKDYLTFTGIQFLCRKCLN